MRTSVEILKEMEETGKLQEADFYQALLKERKAPTMPSSMTLKKVLVNRINAIENKEVRENLLLQLEQDR